MEGGAGTDFQDWEVLVSSPTSVGSSQGEDSRDFEEIGADSEGIIRLDHFSLHNNNNNNNNNNDSNRHAIAPYAVAPPRPPFVDDGAVADADAEGSVGSDNPSWIDPSASENRYPVRDSGGLFWSDSGSDQSEERKFGDFEGKDDLGFVEREKSVVGFEGIGENGAKGGELVSFEGEFRDFDGKNELGFEENVNKQVGLEAFGESGSKDKDLSKFWTDSGGDDLVFGDISKVDEGSQVLDAADGVNAAPEENSSIAALDEGKVAGGEKKEKVVWWKVPIEVFKYCVFRVSPVWSFSVAAAVVGFVILGQRLYRMKRKTQSLQLKVTMDDKKVSQFMSRAARLNEAFSVVRRVPIVRPLLPASGVNPWPVMGLR